MKRSFLLLPAVLAILGLSCTKGDEGVHTTVTPGSYRTLNEALSSIAPLSRTVSLGVASGGSVYGTGGTRFYFPPNVFETFSVKFVTGSVQVTVNDWLLKGDMVFGKVLPLTYGKLMRSSGEGYVSVTQDGAPIRIRKGMRIMVNFPQFGANNPTLTGWVGRTVDGSANTINWLEVDTNTIKVVSFADSVSVRADTIGYLQAGTPFTGPNANFTVRLTAPVTLENTAVVALYDGTRSVFPLPSVQNGQVSAVSVPSSAIHVAVMGINTGQFYGGVVAIPNPQTDSIYTVIIKQVEPPTFKLLLNTY